MPTASSNAGQRIPRHELYYIHGGDVVFNVDNTLFRVHRYFFIRDSLWFQNKLPYPLPPGEITEGSSDNFPLTLVDISKIEFEHFLWVFYNPKYSLYDADVDTWTSILKLAHRWEFIEVKALAVRRLERLKDAIAPLQKIVLYQMYDVDRNLLQTAYTALTVRDGHITINEGRELGLQTALLLAQAREDARATRVGNPRSLVNLEGAELDAITNLINKIFQLSPSAGHENTTNASQMPTGSGSGTQANPGSSSSASKPGTGSANGPTNGQLNGQANGTAFNHSQNGTPRTNGRGPKP
ncbi:hypothetical protein EDB87DRAFT_37252 [Lactarius vividus]|nr:hypothetical protein EDB87DRAFT_37252 [Lactarius vividus]